MNMAYEVSWYIEGRVIFSRFSGDVTIDDLDQVNKLVIEFLDSSASNAVHHLSDATGIDSHPNNAFALQNSQSYLKHSRLGWVVVYGVKNKTLNFLSALVTQVLKVRVRMLASHDEAVTFLQQVDKTLPELKR
jgi:hypothetical protein